jgi:hypothetical protein
MRNISKFSDLAGAINAGLQNVNKWYRKSDDTDIYFVCLGTFKACFFELNVSKHFSALNPNCKMAYVEDKWDNEYVVEAKQRFEILVSNMSTSVYLYALIVLW